MTDRWLLPFTQGVDMRTIEYAVHLAESSGAMLVTASLITVPAKPSNQGARLEHIQQSKDFLEAIKWKAARIQLQTERYEIFTSDVIQSITLLVNDLHCDSIVLATGEEKALLMQTHEINRLLAHPPVSLVLIRFQVQEKKANEPYRNYAFRSWLRALRGWLQRDQVVRPQQALEISETEGPMWIRMEEHHRR